MADPDNAAALSGPQRAAVLLMTLGTDVAGEVLKLCSPKEVQILGSAMSQLENLNKSTVDSVMDAFLEGVGNQTALGIGTDDYIREMMVSALGEDKAGSMIDRILLGSGSKGLEALKWMDARTVAEMIRLEHPQIISIVLAYLDPDQAAEVLAQLPERSRADILMRVATLESIPPSALQELDQIMESQFSDTSNLSTASLGGLKTAANMLNFMDSNSEQAIMGEVGESDEEMAQGIADLMFVFDNLAEVDDRGIQSLLREISSDILVVALRGADAAISDKILNNMSKRAGEMLREDLEDSAPVRLSEVEAAQKEILTVARRMSDEGELNLGGSGGEDFV